MTLHQRLVQGPRLSTTAHLYAHRLGTTSRGHVQICIKRTESLQGISLLIFVMLFLLAGAQIVKIPHARINLGREHFHNEPIRLRGTTPITFLPRVPEPRLEVLVVRLELLLTPVCPAVLDLEVDGKNSDQEDVE